MREGRIVSLGRLLPGALALDRLAFPARARLFDAGDGSGRLLTRLSAGLLTRLLAHVLASWGVLAGVAAMAAAAGFALPSGRGRGFGGGRRLAHPGNALPDELLDCCHGLAIGRGHQGDGGTSA